MQACPFQCIFCDQHKITGHLEALGEKDITGKISGYLYRNVKTHGRASFPSFAHATPHSPGRASFPSAAYATPHSPGRASLLTPPHIEVGFFGGTFTGLPLSVQQHYLSVIQPYLDRGEIQAVRLSTRPDFIDDEKLVFLSKFRVSTIELGAQSMDDEVLKKSGRGHKSAVTTSAAKKIVESGFRLGLQMMIGLPGDTLEKSVETARSFVRLGAADVRIYPALVIKGTALETLFGQGNYTPLSLEEAVQWTKTILPIFENAGVNVIRVGLHPSEGLLSGQDIVAGPFHVSFKELVLTELWGDLLDHISVENDKKQIVISVAEGQINYAVGHGKKNKHLLEQKFEKVKFREDKNLQNRQFHVDFY